MNKKKEVHVVTHNIVEEDEPKESPPELTEKQKKRAEFLKKLRG